MRAALYLRVLTAEQTTDNQERELRAAAARMGHDVVEVYRDHAVSGSKCRDKRPGFDNLHRDATCSSQRRSRLMTDVTGR
jgi:DNA invertase Pin-like site-specific DNA recombinase